MADIGEPDGERRERAPDGERREREPDGKRGSPMAREGARWREVREGA